MTGSPRDAKSQPLQLHLASPQQPSAVFLKDLELKIMLKPSTGFHHDNCRYHPTLSLPSCPSLASTLLYLPYLAPYNSEPETAASAHLKNEPLALSFPFLSYLPFLPCTDRDRLCQSEKHARCLSIHASIFHLRNAEFRILDSDHAKGGNLHLPPRPLPYQPHPYLLFSSSQSH